MNGSNAVAYEQRLIWLNRLVDGLSRDNGLLLDINVYDFIIQELIIISWSRHFIYKTNDDVDDMMEIV